MHKKHLAYKLLLVFGIVNMTLLTTQYIFGFSGPICNVLLNSEKDSWILKCEQFLDPIL